MVMVSHSKKFIFLKTRKTAGTSIEMFLEPYCAAPDHQVKERTVSLESQYGIVGARKLGTLSADQDSLKFINHMPAIEIKAEIGAEIWNAYTKITSVRNPFARVISLFHFRNRQNDQLNSADADETRALFKQFLDNGNWNNDHDVVHIDDEFQPETLICYETLAQDMADLAAKIGLKPDTTLPSTKNYKHLKRMAVPDYFDAYTTAFICENWAWMFDKIGYSKNPIDFAEPYHA